MSVALLLLFQCSTICDNKETDAVPFLSAKVVRGLWLFSSQALNNSSKGQCHLVCLENLHIYGWYFPPKPCASPTHLPLFCYKKESAYSYKPKLDKWKVQFQYSLYHHSSPPGGFKSNPSCSISSIILELLMPKNLCARAYW